MSLGNPNLFDTNVLVAVIPNLKRPQKFLLDRFFPNIVTSDTEAVSIDVEVGLRRMAPFVSPLVEGKVVQGRAVQTNSFKPAYIKDKRVPDLRKPVRRMIGEKIGGSMTPAQREQANLEYEMTDQVDLIDRRCEWMAASALVSGTVLIQGEGYPPVMVDFGRDASLTIAKAAGGKWTAANIAAGTASPTQDIENWQTQILKKSGAVVTDLVFTTGSWAGFLLDPKLQGAIIYPKMSDSGNSINSGAQVAQGAVYKGKWGQYDLWLYNDWFIDDNNVEQPMIPDGTLIMTGAALMGSRNFGIILDPKFSYQPMPYAPKTWVSDDPAQRYLMMQSAPIMVPFRPNASLAATVI